MGFDIELHSMMPHKVKIAPYSAQNKFGEPTYGSDVSYTAMVEQRVRQVRAMTGEERISTTTVYLDTTTALTPRDRVTLPSGYVPNQPPIISIERLSDEDGLHSTVLHL